MEFLEAVSVFAGRDNRFLHGTSDAGFGGGSVFLYCGFYDDCFYHCPQDDIRRSGIGLAVAGVHYTDDQRSTVFLYRNFGTISREDVYGSEKAADIFGEGAVLTGSHFWYDIYYPIYICSAGKKQQSIWKGEFAWRLLQLRIMNLRNILLKSC